MKEYPSLTNSTDYFKSSRTGNNEFLQNLGAPHIESFNYMLKYGLADCARNIRPIKFEMENKDRIELWIENITVSKPRVPQTAIKVRTKAMYPSECRQRAISYKGMCDVRMGWRVNGQKMPSIDKELGEVPIMLQSDACHLNGLTPQQLVTKGEHEQEWGGYFIVKGHEKLIRMLLMTRKNFPMSVKRNTWKNRGKYFSDTGIMIRTVKPDQTSTTNVLHFITNGTCKFMMSHRRMMSYIPPIILLKALANHTDEYIYQQLVHGYTDDQYYINGIQQMLRQLHDEASVHSNGEAREYLGNIFRSRFFDLHPWITNVEITDYMLSECVLIHLTDYEDKFNLIVFMVQKLYQCVQGKSKIENADSVMMQEILLGGHLYQKVIKDRVENWLRQTKFTLLKRTEPHASISQTSMGTTLRYVSNIERAVENFLATGNVNTASNMGLMQTSGLVIMAENINRMRYMSHFRAVHRGSFFVEMRTTEARQLLPDAWGFICPVHTPDGTPCGLLNHLTVHCKVSDRPSDDHLREIPIVLCELGMHPIDLPMQEPAKADDNADEPYNCVVMVEGRIVGHIRFCDAKAVEAKLRRMKIEGKRVPPMMEIAVVPNKKNGQFPGLYLFVGSARMMRPVTNLAVNAVEYIGTFEQVYMDIAVCAEEAYPDKTTHMELSKVAFMSNLANLIPMPDCNQSPRNMYQCQMGKQTMGTPCHNWQMQAESKLYRLQTPATPLFRPVHHDNIDLDDFAMGTNAIVAVISYTGYDMEDAMIINKSADERGFAHGSIQKSEFIELNDDSYFARNPLDKRLEAFIDNDGLPFVGRRLTGKDPFYCYYDSNEAAYRVVPFFGKEECFVDNIKICGTFSTNPPKKACITIRVPRNSSVGDKFASRAGQKGICSQKWPAEDLPFTESGLIPDIVFNPHGFPSRMTIAMMIETMAGKTGSVHGLVHDATPFRFTEKDTAIDYFGKLLTDGGYNYYGTEQMYSGIDGREMTVDIFFGVVHYQRLRHMVSDKWQVRSTGPIDPSTHQPIKGRKRGGGVRFGEMERDALIAHGASFLLQDRLMHCSDKVSVQMCKKCGTLVGPMNEIAKMGSDSKIVRTKAICQLCGIESNMGKVEIPYIYKFLIAQLSAININVKMSNSDI